MSQTKRRGWQHKRTAESRRVEELLRPSFERVDAYRYNRASIRVRVIDPRFEGKSHFKRSAMVEPLLRQLPPDVESDIMNLTLLAPSEVANGAPFSHANSEFEEPSPSRL